MIRFSIVMLFILSINLFGKPTREYTNFSLIGGIYGGFNIHTSDFTNLPNYSSCCSEFKKGAGLGLNFGAGAEYKLSQNLLSGLSYRFFISYSDFSGVINNEKIIGYDIDGNSYSDIVVDFSYDNLIPVLLTEHYFSLKISETLPLNILGGFQVGFPLSGTTNYQEKLKSPSGRLFENGMTVRNIQSGEIFDLSSLYFGLSLGANYDVYNLGAFTISPEILFTYGLTNILNSTDWKISQARAGFVVKYNVPKALPKVEKPKDPPPPILPEAPKPLAEPVMDISIEVEINGTKISENDNFNSFFDKEYLVAQQNVTGILFPKDDDFDVDIAKLIRSLKQNKVEDIELRIISDDGNNIEQNFNPKILNTGFKVNKIEKIRPEINKKDYVQLSEESDRIEVLVNSQVYIGKIIDTISTKINSDKLLLDIKYDITSNYDIERKEGSLFLEDKNIISLNKENSIRIHDLINNGDNQFKIIVSGESEIRKEETFEFNVISELRKESVEIIHDRSDKADILALSEFDKSGFYSINRELLNKAIEWLDANESNSVVLSASTDNLGTEIYNTDLSRKRAQNGLKLFPSKYHNRIQIAEEIIQSFDNMKAIGRVKNRSVVILLK